MILRPAFAFALTIIVAACGTPPERQGVDPATIGETQALEDAASMLEDGGTPPADTQMPETQEPATQIPGETR